VTIFARLLSLLPTPRSTFGRRLVLIPGLTTCLAAASLIAPAPSGAVVSVVGSSTVGLQARHTDKLFDGTLEETEFNEINEYPAPEKFANPAGNPVVHASNIYAIYWDPTDHYHGDWQSVIDGFLRGVGTQTSSLSSVFAVDAQYTDSSNVPAYNRETFRGAIPDTNAYPTAGCTDPRPLTKYEAHHTYPLGCVTDEQIHQELQSFIVAHGLPTGMNTIYYVLTPPGVAVCLDAGGAGGHCSDFEATELEEAEENVVTASYKKSFCSYHSDLNPGGLATGDANTVLYGVIPWVAGGLGDGQLAAVDQTRGYYCQDGGFNPVSKPIEKREVPAVQQEPNQRPCPTADGFCDTGLADLIINQIAVEQQNIMTDPLLNAWQDEAGNEATDECRNVFAPAVGGYGASPESEAGTLSNQSLAGGKYYLNDAFNLAALRLTYPGVPCLTRVTLEPKFTAPNTVNSGDVVAFDGMESNISLNSAIGYAGGGQTANYATYSWNFGDGSPAVVGYAPGAPACTTPWLTPCAAGVLHAYTYGGTYTVSLTVTDVGGNTASVSAPIVVVGPPPPSSSGSGPGGAGAGGGAAGSTGGASSTAGGSSTTAGGSSTTTSPVVPTPVAAAAVISHSLRSVLRHGLVVRYSVNEQVAGHFEVLLNRALARHLGITGAPAEGLPAGTAAQVVIGKAILVTTAAGRSTVTIQFTKRTASRLGRLHKVTLLIRLVVRNAALHSPATTTVLGSVTLSH
jgi:hypothetical protein